jgi:hypothetical protein
MSDVDWGSVPEWVAAVGTVGTLVYATVLLGKQRQRLQQEVDRHDREQASLVSAWVKLEHGGQLSVRLRNANDVPIYQCYLELLDPDGGVLDQRFEESVPPGEHDLSPYDHELQFDPDLVSVKLDFFDPEGRHWVRRPNGTLDSLPD